MMAEWEGEGEQPDINEVAIIPPQRDLLLPVGKTEPIKPDNRLYIPHFLDTLVYRDDLNSQQRESAERAIEDIKGLLRVGWIREG